MRGLFYSSNVVPVSAEYDYYACMSNWCLGVDFILGRKLEGEEGRGMTLEVLESSTV